MYVLVEDLTILALVVLLATLLFAGSVVLVALGQAIQAARRSAHKAAEPAMTQQPRLSADLQPVILTSTELLAR